MPTRVQEIVRAAEGWAAARYEWHLHGAKVDIAYDCAIHELGQCVALPPDPVPTDATVLDRVQGLLHELNLSGAMSDVRYEQFYEVIPDALWHRWYEARTTTGAA